MNHTHWDARRYQAHAAFVPALADTVLKRLTPQPHESILDLGCGDGSLSLRIAESNCQLICVDASQSMIDSARRKGLEAKVLDGQALPFTSRFDAVFSNAALHWMTRPREVLSGIYKALKPGGRFVAEFGGQGNIDQLVNAMTAVFDNHPDWGDFHNPWFFPSAEHYQGYLEAQGFQVTSCATHHRPTAIEGSIRGWLEVFSQGICADLSPQQREIFYTETEKRLTFQNGQTQHPLMLDYVRLGVEAHKPADC